MDLTDTIKLMVSDDKKENMLAEYYQLIIRQEMLKSEQINEPYSFDKFLKGAQIKAMEEYKKVLERRLQEIQVKPRKKPDFWF